jgi:hypothetical protein
MQTFGNQTFINTNLLDCAHPARALAQRLDRIRVRRQHQNAVLQVLLFPPVIEILRQAVRGSLKDNEDKLT